ncbi:MAG: transglycosylase SLT domain-containing protein [Elusimicrobia bacterium]|nr:transglycosylase SLT domain-containing protein [Elusimicrobiota bacterium]
MIFLLNKKYFIFLFFFLFAVAGIAYPFCVKIQNPEDNKTVSGMVNITAGFYPNKCDKNKSYKEIDDLLSNTNSNFDKDLLKAIAWQESRWQQFNENGNTYRCVNTDESTDCGLMQINSENSGLLEENGWDFKRIGTDTEYNLKAALQILTNKQNELNRIKNVRPKRWNELVRQYDFQGHSMQDIVLKYYNTLRKSWEYPDAINKNIKDKPWIQKVTSSLSIDDETKIKKEVALIEALQYSWDTSNVKEGDHRIKAIAVSKRGSSSDVVTVIIEKAEKEKEGVGRGEIVIEQKWPYALVDVYKVKGTIKITNLKMTDHKKDKSGSVDVPTLRYDGDGTIKYVQPVIIEHNQYTKSTTNFTIKNTEIKFKIRVTFDEESEINGGDVNRYVGLIDLYDLNEKILGDRSAYIVSDDGSFAQKVNEPNIEITFPKSFFGKTEISDRAIKIIIDYDNQLEKVNGLVQANY